MLEGTLLQKQVLGKVRLFEIILQVWTKNVHTNFKLLIKC